MLASTKIIDFLSSEDSKDTKTAYFYCDYGDLKTLRATQILKALSRQLLEPIDLPPCVTEEPCFLHGNRSLEFDETSRILRSAISLYSTIYVVVDGLDKYSKNDQTKVLKTLKEFTSLTGILVKVFISSRNPADNSNGFKMPRTISITVTTNSADISAYVRGNVSSLRESRKLKIQNENLVNEII
jgi:hypothetical protein